MTRARRGLSSMRRPGLAASAALLLAALGTPGLAATSPPLTISHPWMRFMTLEIPAAGYFTLHNNGAHPVDLVGAKSPDCGQLMLHQSVVTNGMAHMKMVHSIVVPPHGSIAFRPGGYHLMCMSPSTAISPGQKVPVALRFQDGTSLSAQFAVYGATGK